MRIQRLNLIKRLKSFVIKIWMQDGSPGQRARGIAIGVFSGCFPFFGFQTVIGVALAKLIKGNLILAAAGTWVSNPVTYIPLFLFNYKIGEFFLGSVKNVDDIEKLSLQQLFDKGLFFSNRILLGSTIIGFLLGASIGFIFYLFYDRRIKRKLFKKNLFYKSFL